jgi:hypothetical protein
MSALNAVWSDAWSRGHAEGGSGRSREAPSHFGPFAQRAWEEGWLYGNASRQPQQTPPEPANPLGGTGQPADASGASGVAVCGNLEGGT